MACRSSRGVQSSAINNTICGSFVIFQGIRASIAKKPYSFVIFHGGSSPLPPSGSAHAKVHIVKQMKDCIQSPMVIDLLVLDKIFKGFIPMCMAAS